MSNAWHYAQNGITLGPVPEEKLRDLIASGVLSGSDFVWQNGMETWAPIQSVLGLMAVSPMLNPPPPPPPTSTTGNVIRNNIASHVARIVGGVTGKVISDKTALRIAAGIGGLVSVIVISSQDPALGSCLWSLIVIVGIVFIFKKVQTDKAAAHREKSRIYLENYVNSNFNKLYQEKLTLMEELIWKDHGRNMTDDEKQELAKYVRTYLSDKYRSLAEQKRKQLELEKLVADTAGYTGLHLNMRPESANKGGFLGMGYSDVDLDHDNPGWVNSSRYICMHCGRRFIDPSSANGQGCHRSPTNQHVLTAK